MKFGCVLALGVVFLAGIAPLHADQYTYVAAPTVSALSQTSGPAAGGTSVTITGTNFTGATGVKSAGAGAGGGAGAGAGAEATGGAAGVAEGADLLEVDVRHTGAFEEDAVGGGVQGFVVLYEVPEQGPLAFEYGQIAFDQEDLEGVLVEAKNYAIHREGDAGI